MLDLRKSFSKNMEFECDDCGLLFVVTTFMVYGRKDSAMVTFNYINHRGFS